MERLKSNELFLNIVMPVILIILIILSIVLPVYFSDSKTLEGKDTKITCERVVEFENPETGLIEEVKQKVQYDGYEIENLQKLNAFKKVNHYPNQYITPFDKTCKTYKQGSFEDIDNLSLTDHGTLQFVVYNYTKDEYSSNKNNIFADNQSKLSNLLFYLPFAFDSATVWVQDKYYGTYGSMNNYEIERYNVSNKDITFEKKDKSPIAIKLQLIYDDKYLSNDPMEQAQIITIHYQAAQGVNFKSNIPLIGTFEEVSKTVQDKKIITISFISIMVALLVGFLGLIFLKVSKEHIPFLGIAFSALLLLISQLTVMFSTVAIAKIMSLISVSVLIYFAMLSCKPKEKKLLIVWRQICNLSLINITIMLIVCLSTDYEFALMYSKISLTTFCIIGFLGTFLSVSNMSSVQCIGILISFVVPILLLFTNYVVASFMHPACLTLSISAIIILWHIFNDMYDLEKRNQLLTKNLKLEVDTQTKNLKSALKDRETLISFISHDLRKASLSIDVLTNDMLVLDTGERERQLTDQIKTKNKVVLNSLGEISTFMKRNFSDEEFTTCKVKDLFAVLEKTIKPDCEANGINFIIKNNRYSVRCKKRALLSVISNLIFNAIEHAECQNITLYSEKVGDKVKIYVCDDGKGIENENVFSPYVTSQSKDSNMGLGLFIVKTETEAQGGTIEYKKENGSIFIVTLQRDYDNK